MQNYGQPGGAGPMPQSGSQQGGYGTGGYQQPQMQQPPQTQTQPYPQQGVPQQITPAPPPKKKKSGKGLIAGGIVLLIIGILIAVLGYLPTMDAITAAELEDDYDYGKNGFESYEEGDTILVTGEVTNKSKSAVPGLSGEVYSYELDDEEIGFLSAEDIANEGETITVECEVHEGNLGGGNTYEYLEARSVMNIMPILIVGIILLVVGIILMALGFRRRRKAQFM